MESLESTQEARVSLDYRLEQLLHFHALQPSHMHPQLHIRTLSMLTFSFILTEMLFQVGLMENIYDQFCLVYNWRKEQ